jgi:hypothetical protein
MARGRAGDVRGALDDLLGREAKGRGDCAQGARRFQLACMPGGEDERARDGVNEGRAGLTDEDLGSGNRDSGDKGLATAVDGVERKWEERSFDKVGRAD